MINKITKNEIMNKLFINFKLDESKQNNKLTEELKKIAMDLLNKSEEDITESDITFEMYNIAVRNLIEDAFGDLE